jgi:hypothetical protein
MTVAKKSEETVFQVRLNGFPLSPDQEKRISVAIRSAAFAELAKLDFRDGCEIRSLAGPGEYEGFEATRNAEK